MTFLSPNLAFIHSIPSPAQLTQSPPITHLPISSIPSFHPCLSLSLIYLSVHPSIHLSIPLSLFSISGGSATHRALCEALRMQSK